MSIGSSRRAWNSLALKLEHIYYDLLVSFSGIEHSGLGRYGDPVNPDADIEAMAQIHRALAPGGYLLLAIPTADRLIIEANLWPWSICSDDRTFRFRR